MTSPKPGPSSLLLPRLVGALALRPRIYAQIAADDGASLQAGLVVVLAGMIEAAVSAAAHGEESLDSLHLVYGVLAALIGWVVWSGILFLVGGRIFDHEVEFAATLRAVGFTHSATLVYGLAALSLLTPWAGLLLLASLLWFAASLAAATAGIFAVERPRALLITLVALIGHEVLRQGLRLSGLVG